MFDSKKYYIKNRERILGREKRRHKDDPEKAREQRKRYRENNPGKVKEQKRRWYLKNKEKMSGERKRYYIKNRIDIILKSKKYYIGNREKILEQQKQLRKNDPEKIKEQKKLYYENNKGKIKEHNRERYEKNREKCLERIKKWRTNNKEKVRKDYNKWNKNKRKTDLKCNLNHKISTAIGISLKGNKAGRHWETLVGYSLENLIKRLIKTMPEGYTWQDYINGELHIDHIIPISVFNFDKPEHTDFRKCWALSNLQLLPAKENIGKSNKLIRSFQPALKI